MNDLMDEYCFEKANRKRKERKHMPLTNGIRATIAQKHLK